MKQAPTQSELIIGTSVRIYDKDTKTYPKTGTIIEKLRNSSFLVEFDTPEGQILAQHSRHLKPLHSDTIPLPQTGEI